MQEQQNSVAGRGFKRPDWSTVDLYSGNKDTPQSNTVSVETFIETVVNYMAMEGLANKEGSLSLLRFKLEDFISQTLEAEKKRWRKEVEWLWGTAHHIDGLEARIVDKSALDAVLQKII